MTRKLPVTMNADEIEYFEQYLMNTSPNFKMVEWGSGGSTCMFLDFMTEDRSMVSIEHNEEWYEKVTEAVKDHPNRSKLTYLFIPPEMHLSFYGYGQPQEENPTYNAEYIQPHLSFDDIEFWDADMYLVDGISRGACIMSVYKNANIIIKPEIDVFLHDYVGREQWYDWAVSSFQSKKVVGSTLLHMLF